MGFRTIHVNGVMIEVNQLARLDFALTLDSKSDSITVLGSAPLLNTWGASVSTLFNNRFVDNMPLNGRSLEMAENQQHLFLWIFFLFSVSPCPCGKFFMPWSKGSQSISGNHVSI